MVGMVATLTEATEAIHTEEIPTGVTPTGVIPTEEVPMDQPLQRDVRVNITMTITTSGAKLVKQDIINIRPPLELLLALLVNLDVLLAQEPTLVNSVLPLISLKSQESVLLVGTGAKPVKMPQFVLLVVLNTSNKPMEAVFSVLLVVVYVTINTLVKLAAVVTSKHLLKNVQLVSQDVVFVLVVPDVRNVVLDTL